MKAPFAAELKSATQVTLFPGCFPRVATSNSKAPSRPTSHYTQHKKLWGTLSSGLPFRNCKAGCTNIGPPVSLCYLLLQHPARGISASRLISTSCSAITRLLPVFGILYIPSHCLQGSTIPPSPSSSWICSGEQNHRDLGIEVLNLLVRVLGKHQQLASLIAAFQIKSLLGGAQQ